MSLHSLKIPALKPEGTGYLYRYQNYGDTIHLEQYTIVSKTPKGVWVVYGVYDERFPFRDNALATKKWVSMESKKRLCYPTLKEAWDAFKHRKYRQIKILEAQLHNANSVMRVPFEDMQGMFYTVPPESTGFLPS